MDKRSQKRNPRSASAPAGKPLDSTEVLHPNPQFRRDDWTSLDGQIGRAHV